MKSGRVTRQFEKKNRHVPSGEFWQNSANRQNSPRAPSSRTLPPARRAHAPHATPDANDHACGCAHGADRGKAIWPFPLFCSTDLFLPSRVRGRFVNVVVPDALPSPFLLALRYHEPCAAGGPSLRRRAAESRPASFGPPPSVSPRLHRPAPSVPQQNSLPSKHGRRGLTITCLPDRCARTSSS